MKSRPQSLKDKKKGFKGALKGGKKGIIIILKTKKNKKAIK